jgi:ribosome modulation factor
MNLPARKKPLHETLAKAPMTVSSVIGHAQARVNRLKSESWQQKDVRQRQAKPESLIDRLIPPVNEGFKSPEHYSEPDKRKSWLGSWGRDEVNAEPAPAEPAPAERPKKRKAWLGNWGKKQEHCGTCPCPKCGHVNAKGVMRCVKCGVGTEPS